jgi:hypothetical protein
MEEPKRPAWTLAVDELEAMLERAAAAGAARALDHHKPAAWTDQEGIAAHLGISQPTLRKLIDGGLPHSWSEGKRIFCYEEVDEYMKTVGRQKPPSKE